VLLPVFVITQVRCCPDVIVPLQPPVNEVPVTSKSADGGTSVTLNVPGLRVTSVPVPEPLKLARVGLLPETCIVKSDAVTLVSKPTNIFKTVNKPVDGIGVGVGVV